MMTTMPKPAKADPRRQALQRKLQVARKQLALDDDTYRALLARHGHASSADMPAAALAAVIEELKAKGWADKPKAPKRAASKRPLADGPTAAKIRALWLACYHLGAVSDPSEAALEAFVKRQTKVDKLAWLPADRAGPVIEALKAMAGRKGVVWSRDPGQAQRDVVAAQGRRLGLDIAQVAEIGWQHGLPVALFAYEDTDWIALMEILGKRLREAGR